MAKNIILSAQTAKDIDGRIERVLRGLGNPEPPLRLADVRELLRLDRVFYSADDPSLIDEVVSRIHVATKQVFKRPMLLVEAIKKLSLKALYIPDRKRILLDANLPEKKHRWNEGHEIGHSVIPWHDDFMMGDNDHTLTPDCSAQIEAEANFASGRLLFLRDRFAAEALDMSRSIESVRVLNRRYGNTLSTTLYRFAETTGEDLPVIGMITAHPHPSYWTADFNPKFPCRYFIQSPAFAARFSRVSEVDVFNSVTTYCGRQRGGPLGGDEIVLTDDNGDQHYFLFQTFYNTYDALTLGVYLKPIFQTVAVA